VNARCPHCHAVARFERSRAFRWRCGVCGGPLVPTDEGVTRAHGELASLVTAQRTRAMAVGWTAAAIVLGTVGVLGIGLAALVWLATHAAAILLAVLAGVAGMLAAASVRRARARDAESQAAVERAWEVAAGEVVSARKGETTAAQLAAAMQTDEDHAQGLLALLSASGHVRVDVRDDAELAYHAEATNAEEPAAEDEAAPARKMRAP
jgi:hypothetical protein